MSQKNKKRFGPRFAKEVGMGNPAEKTIRNPNLELFLVKEQTPVNKKFVLPQNFFRTGQSIQFQAVQNRRA
jgi:hypothetical protein